MNRVQCLRDVRRVNRMFNLLADDLFFDPHDQHYAPSKEFGSLVERLLHAKSTQWEFDRGYVLILASINGKE